MLPIGKEMPSNDDLIKNSYTTDFSTLIWRPIIPCPEVLKQLGIEGIITTVTPPVYNEDPYINPEGDRIPIRKMGRFLQEEWCINDLRNKNENKPAIYLWPKDKFVAIFYFVINGSKIGGWLWEMPLSELICEPNCKHCH